MTTPLRVYGGIAGEDRQVQRRAQLIEAGLELLGAQEGEPNLTVRGVCKQSGLAARYFYENFADRDALAAAVIDHVVDDLAATTLEAVTAAPDPPSKVRAGLATIVRGIADDPRRGRLLFSPTLTSTVLVQRRVESTRLFARLLGLQAQEVYGITSSTRLDLLADFLVGGLAQTLTSWLDHTLDATEDEIIEHCAEIFLSAANTHK